MSASFALVEQEDGLAKLLKLASLNVDSIKASGEETRKQIQLTQAKEGEVAEAKAYIAKYAALAADLQGRESALASGIESLAKAKEEFAEHVASENTRLETLAATLTAKEKEQAKTDERHAGESGNIIAQKSANIKEHQQAMDACQNQQAVNIAVAKTNAIENDRLKEWESTLKKKADILRQQASQF